MPLPFVAGFIVGAGFYCYLKESDDAIACNIINNCIVKFRLREK